ncbi:MAG: Ig-like domain-containing protein, partial [Chloroflexota bacterium]
MAAAAVFTVIIVLSQQTATQAGPEVARPVPQSLLPRAIGVAVAADDPVLVTFDEPMDAASVEAALQLVPAHAASLSWNEDLTELSIAPERRWRTDESYLVVVGASATADGDTSAAPRRFAFSTETAPTVSDFQVRSVGVDPIRDGRMEAAPAAVQLELRLSEERTLSPDQTAREVSPLSSVRIGFSSPMGRSDVEERFTITPEVAGELSWSGDDLVFTPTERLESGGRYTISLFGARDRAGNELGGKLNFTFVVRSPSQLISTTPALDAQDVETGTVEMWFSQPMDVDATNAAFGLTDTRTGRLVAGFLNWNEAATQLVYSPSRAFAGGRTFEVALGAGAVDAEGNPFETAWSFSTAAVATRAAAADGG